MQCLAETEIYQQITRIRGRWGRSRSRHRVHQILGSIQLRSADHLLSVFLLQVSCSATLTHLNDCEIERIPNKERRCDKQTALL